MKLFILLILTLLPNCVSNPKISERRRVYDEVFYLEAKELKKDFIKLSNYNNISFTKDVSISFSNIHRKNTIGLCFYYPLYRRIILDSKFWSEASLASKMALVYHELSHCLCNRDHDYDEGKNYEKNIIEMVKDIFKEKETLYPEIPPGFMKDMCPKSIMHPVLLEDYCFIVHEEYYIKEMLNRCDPF